MRGLIYSNPLNRHWLAVAIFVNWGWFTYDDHHTSNNSICLNVCTARARGHNMEYDIEKVQSQLGVVVLSAFFLLYFFELASGRMKPVIRKPLLPKKELPKKSAV